MSGVYAALGRPPCITPSTTIQSADELEQALCRLFHSADTNDVPIRHTWRCQYDDRPDLEVMVFTLAARSE